MNTSTIMCVVGARPNFMKIAPVMRALKASDTLKPCLVHTGQHYDAAMKHAFFDQLDIPEPDVDLEVGSGTHAVQTAEIMLRFEPVLDEHKPAAILVVGDVNSTIACSLVAAKKGIPVIHVEAGLRSYDREMPEEINRVLTDQISDLLFITESGAVANLEREGISNARVHFVGNVMIDTLRHQLDNATPPGKTLSHVTNNESVLENGYALLTLHRPSNVDDPVILERLLKTIQTISITLPVVFPVHPRTKACIEKAGLDGMLDGVGIIKLNPLGYKEMLGLMANARMVLTDSGGIQEETTALGVPCITLRENTERPITVEQGTNTIAGTNSEAILAAFDETMKTGGKAGQVPEKWDGQAAQRIIDVIENWIAKNR